MASLVAAGCGRDDFDNDPRPPLPAEIGITVGDEGIEVSPERFGAGLANLTVVNLTDSETTVKLDGPTEDETPPIPAGRNTILKTTFEPGEYEITAGAFARPVRIDVGPERESGQDELLLP